MPHEFGDAKRERHLDLVSAASIRTAEVTIFETVRSPSTVTVRLKTQVVEDNVKGVIAQGIECSTHHDIRTESMHEINAISRCTVVAVHAQIIGFQ